MESKPIEAKENKSKTSKMQTKTLNYIRNKKNKVMNITKRKIKTKTKTFTLSIINGFILIFIYVPFSMILGSRDTSFSNIAICLKITILSFKIILKNIHIYI